MAANVDRELRVDLVCRWKVFPEKAGAYLLLDPSSQDPIVKSYLAGEHNNDYMLDVMAQMTVPGDMVVDLGCHVGTFTLGALAMGREVVSIDANPFHVALVQHAARLNGFTSLSMHWNAISQTPGTIRFKENGLFGAVDFTGALDGTIEVATVRLDDVVPQAGKPIRFLKMDVEGAEYDALMGARTMLERDGPAVLFESNPPTLEAAGQSVASLRRLFESMGYRVFRTEGDRLIYSPPEEIQPEAWVDMLALTAAQQQSWFSRIDWHWEAGLVERRCAEWAALPFPNVKAYLLREITEKHAAVGLRAGVLDVAERLRTELGSAVPEPVPAPKPEAMALI